MDGDWVKTKSGWRLPRLFKLEANGDLRQWDIAVKVRDDGTATIRVDHGKVDGKLQQKLEHITSGKNLGKKNATTPVQQAMLEAHATWTIKQRRKGYALDATKLRSDYRPMLAVKYKDLVVDFWDDAYVQRKYDGFRCLATWNADDETVVLRGREGLEFTTLPHLTAHIRKLCRQASQPSCIFDGELYSHALTFSQISSAIKRVEDQDIAMVEQIGYRCYDVVDEEATFVERFIKGIPEMRRAVTQSKSSLVEFALTKRVDNEAELMQFQAEVIADGYEGAILRRGSGVYQRKRSGHLIKVKTFEDDEFKVTAMREARDGTAVFKCVTPQGHHFDVTAPGTMDEKRRYLTGPSCIGRYLTVKYEGMTTSSKPVPRNPVGVRFRPTGKRAHR